MKEFTDDKRFHRFQRIGDIIFVSSKKFPNANLLTQSLIAGNTARYSHVLLCVLPGLYVHSMPENGVQFLQGESPDADFDKKYGTAWAVRRLRRLSDNPELAGRLSWRAAYYLGQSYNWVFLGSRLIGQSYSTSHSFCSELIVRIFNDVGVPILQPAFAPEKALPAHLDEATLSDDWTDLTSSYHSLFQPPEPSEFDRLLDQFLPVPDGRLAYIKMVTDQPAQDRRGDQDADDFG